MFKKSEITEWLLAGKVKTKEEEEKEVEKIVSNKKREKNGYNNGLLSF